MNTLTRLVAPVALLLALALYLFLPVAGASCGRADGGPAHLCYTGGQLITRDPGLDLSDILAGEDLHDLLVNTVDLPTAATVLALATAIVVALGVVVAALRRPTLAVVAAITGAILAVITEAVAVNGLTEGVGFVPNLFGGFDDLDPATILSTELGFWLTLAALATACAGALVQRNAHKDRDYWATGDLGAEI